MPKKNRYSRNPYIFLLQVAWNYAYSGRKKYVLIYGCFMISNLMQSLLPVAWGIFVNDIQVNGTKALQHAWIYGLVYMLLKLLMWSFHGPSRIVERELAFHISRNYLNELYHKSLRLPVKWHQDHHSGSTINRVRKAHEALRNFFERGFEYLETFFKFLFSFAAMLYFSPLFGGVAVMIGIVVVSIIFRFDKPYIKTLDQVNEAEHVVSSTLFDSLSNVITVITLRLQERMEKILDNRVKAIFPHFRKNTLINEWKWFVTDMLVAFTYVVIVVGYVWQHWTPGQVFLLGGLVTLAGYVSQFTSVFHNVAYLYTDVVRYATDVRTAMVIPEAYARHHLPEASAPLPAEWKEIEVTNLSFSHREYPAVVGGEPDIQHPVAGLQDIHIRLPRGRRIALIGESGSGKSTLLAILRGLYPPGTGAEIRIDGVPQEDGMSRISDHVTLFPQEPEIFENTIEYNITLGLPHETPDIERICSLVHFEEVLRQLPRGLQSSIVEKGVNLSGGQKQRLALARGMFAARDSDIILLDEPTSSVDPRTELLIYEQLFREFSDKVIVSALHRLHLLQYFDHIYVMHQGKIADMGTLEELRNRNGIFTELWKHQELQKRGPGR